MKYYVFTCGHKVKTIPGVKRQRKDPCPICGAKELRGVEITCPDCGKVFEVRPRQSKRERCFDCKYKKTLKINQEWRDRNVPTKRKRGRPPGSKKVEVEKCTCCGIRPVAPGNRFLCDLCYKGDVGSSSRGWDIGGYGEFRLHI